MTDKRKGRFLSLFMAASYAIGLYFFYIRYVPLIKPFQFILIPTLCLVSALTVINVQWGTLLFIFSFPLINNLPYFFGIFEPLPHAPSALLLFLFYFLGWLIHNIFSDSKASVRHPILKPMILFSMIIAVSGIITSLRYTNFYPFLSDYVYEYITNVNGVTAGGSIMSTIFNSLNYLTGFAFFFILLNTVKSKEFIKKILIVLLISTSISVMFGFFQHFKNIKIANNPISFNQGLINGTFKDALSFGAYLGTFVPVLLSMILFFKRSKKIFPSLILIPAIFILPHTGAKSSLLCMILSLFLFFVILAKTNWRKLRFVLSKRLLTSLIILLLIIALIISLLASFQKSIVSKRFTELIYLNRPGEAETGIEIRWNYNWKMASYMMKDYPLTGVGVGSYIIEFPNYIAANKALYRHTDSAENYFLQVGSELGIIALLFALWIFWHVLTKVNKNLGECLAIHRWKYIQIGISCGIITLFINFLVHTYIGSYEIKYTFWLFVAIIFCLSKSEKEPEKALHLSKRSKILYVVIITIFCGGLLWNSTHSLSLERRTEQLDLKQDFGLYQVEKDKEGNEFRWTKSYGGLTIKIRKPTIEIPLLASHPDITKSPVKVKIYLIKDFFKQKKLLDEIILSQNRWETYEYYIPEEVNQEVILLIKVSRIWNPLNTLGTPDPRNLGVAVGKIKFRENIAKDK